MRTRRSGSGRYSRGRRRTPSGTSTSSWCSAWAARRSSPRGEVTELASSLESGLTSCPYSTPLTIPGYSPSCRAMVTPHAASFGYYCKHRCGFKTKNDELL